MSITTPQGRIVNLEHSRNGNPGKCDWCEKEIVSVAITSTIGNFCSGACLMAADFESEDSHNQENLIVH